MADQLPYTNRKCVKGRIYWRFRSKETGDVKLPGTPGDPQFHQKYIELLELRQRVHAAAAGIEDEGSWAWLIGRYLRSPEFAALADTTQLDYAATCTLLTAKLGKYPFRFTTRAMIKAVRDDLAATARKAHKVKQMTSRLYSWADEHELVAEGFNPAAGIKRLKRKGGVREYVPWSDAEIDWAIAEAEPYELTPLLLFLYSGQRCADVAAMTWQQWQGEAMRARTSKTHALLEMPCHPVLKAHLEQLRASAKVVSLTGTICLSRKAATYSPNALAGVIRRLVERVPMIPNNRSPHGLRYAAAARMEEGGATPMMIAEVLGHHTYKMAVKYASARLRAAQGIAAMKG